MEYRRLGRSGIKVAPLALGAMNFGGPTDEAESTRIAHAGAIAGLAAGAGDEPDPRRARRLRRAQPARGDRGQFPQHRRLDEDALKLMNSVKLERVSLQAPPGLAELLADLGEGENGFMGTPVATGEMTLPEFLQSCVEMAAGVGLRPGWVPQTVFWVIDQAGQAVGMVRLRHGLNEKLRERGGHIGYYVRRDQRGRGYAREALRQALHELTQFGGTRALLTVNLDNAASIRVIEANGGRLDSVGEGPDGVQFGRYWIEITPRPED